MPVTRFIPIALPALLLGHPAPALAQSDDFSCAQPQLLGSISGLEDPTFMTITNGLAYIIEHETTLAIVDISDPEHMAILGRTEIPYLEAESITLNGRAAYLQHDRHQFSIFDIQDPSDPWFVRFYQGLDLDDGSMPIGQGYMYANQFYIFNVNRPLAPVLDVTLENEDAPESPIAAIVDGVGYSQGLQRYDLSDPRFPTIIDDGQFSPGGGQYLTSDPPYLTTVIPGSSAFSYRYDEELGRYFFNGASIPGVKDAVFHDNIVLAATDQLDIYLTQVTQSGPAGLHIASYSGQPALDNPIAIRKVGDHYCLLNAAGQLAIYDIPTNPIANIPTNGLAQRVELIGDTAFVICSDGLGGSQAYFQSYDIADPRHPELLDTIAYPFNSYAEGFAFYQHYAYIAMRAGGLDIIDIADPANLAVVGHYDTQIDPEFNTATWDIAITGNTAYVADSHSGLHILDLTDPIHPTLIARYDSDIPQRRITLHDNLALVSGGNTDLLILDVSDPDAVTERSRIAPSPESELGFQRHTFDGDLLYTAEQTAGYRVFDLSNPADPIELAHLSTDISTPYGDFVGITYELLVDGDLLYTANSSAGLTIYDNANPLSPILLRHAIAAIPQAGSYVWMRDIELRDNLMFVTAASNGLRVYDLNNCMGPCPADLNADGVLNFFDVSAFLVAFTSQSPPADLNGDGLYNFFDISAYLVSFHNGCP